MNQKIFFKAVLLFLLVLPGPAAAQERVSLDDLGDLEVAFSALEPMNQVPGPPLRAEAQADPGSALLFRLPARAQRAVFRVQPGARVAAGDPVALLEGQELHHWLLEYEALGARFETARERYENNLPLYEEGALSGDRWAGIEERYFALRLEFQHMNHVREWLQPGPDEVPESLLARAPRDGQVLYDSRHTMLEAGDTLFEVLPEGGLRLRVEVPAERAAELDALAFDGCEVGIERVEEAAHGFYRAAWSAPLQGSCVLAPGAALSAEPRYAEEALFVPREAVFQWRRTPHVWLREGDELVAKPVELLADVPEGYAVVAEPGLRDGEVLVRSVSAAQGILLGLGDG